MMLAEYDLGKSSFSNVLGMDYMIDTRSFDFRVVLKEISIDVHNVIMAELYSLVLIRYLHNTLTSLSTI